MFCVPGFLRIPVGHALQEYFPGSVTDIRAGLRWQPLPGGILDRSVYAVFIQVPL